MKDLNLIKYIGLLFLNQFSKELMALITQLISEAAEILQIK